MGTSGMRRAPSFTPPAPVARPCGDWRRRTRKRGLEEEEKDNGKIKGKGKNRGKEKIGRKKKNCYRFLHGRMIGKSIFKGEYN
jgi:hypothetical protein